MTEPIKAQRYIRRDNQWIDVLIYGFVAMQGVALMGTDASTIHAIYIRINGNGELENDNIADFRIIEVAK